MMMLFDDIDRTDLDIPKRSESMFNYLNRSARDVITQGREITEKMYSLFPENKEIRSRIRSGNDNEFVSVFTELYFHAIFKALDFEVLIHPKKEDTSAKPDWLLPVVLPDQANQSSVHKLDQHQC